jgi:hypothetical protein
MVGDPRFDFAEGISLFDPKFLQNSTLYPGIAFSFKPPTRVWVEFFIDYAI